MYEYKRQPLVTAEVYYQSLWKNSSFALFIMLFYVLTGVVGYKLIIPELSWYKILPNVSAILSGTGSIIDEKTVLSNSSETAAPFYASFSRLMFSSSTGIIMVPISHRFFHKLLLKTNK